MTQKAPSMFLFSASLAVLASIFYHIIQKLTPQDLNPVVTLTATYLTALAGTFLLLTIFPISDGLPAEIKRINWASFGLGIAILGIEVGFLLAYRAGWQISILAVVVNVAATLLLIPIGLLFFGEKLAPINVLGIVLAIVGLALVNIKP